MDRPMGVPLETGRDFSGACVKEDIMSLFSLPRLVHPGQVSLAVLTQNSRLEDLCWRIDTTTPVVSLIATQNDSKR